MRSAHTPLDNRAEDPRAPGGPDPSAAGVKGVGSTSAGSSVVLTAASPVGKASTNLLKLHRVGEWPVA